MAKCNLLSPISNQSGNFMLFSQYAEDLTHESQSKDFYRVTPSKYVLIKLNKKEGWTAAKYAEVFQNYYEQSCALWRQSDAIDWKPNYANDLFWKTLIKYDLIVTPHLDESNTIYTSESVRYVGDINITSTRQYDGINYSEIYVNVPSDENHTTRQKIQFLDYPDNAARSENHNGNWICGYPDAEYPHVTDVTWPSNHLDVGGAEYYDGFSSPSTYQYTIFSNYKNLVRTYTFPDLNSYTDIDNEESFDFDAVLVLYNVKKRNMDNVEDTILYDNIPMGLYFTGAPDEDSGSDTYGEIQNPVTIWTSHPDIYEQGTSYGIRICTRYLSTQNSLYIVDSSVEGTNDMYDQYSAVIGKMMQSQQKIDEMADAMDEYQKTITGHLANFKNNKVNVPYLVELGGVHYWFVNGQNLGVAAYQTELTWENY